MRAQMTDRFVHMMMTLLTGPPHPTPHPPAFRVQACCAARRPLPGEAAASAARTLSLTEGRL